VGYKTRDIELNAKEDEGAALVRKFLVQVDPKIEYPCCSCACCYILQKYGQYTMY
jgi:hypothetical protein